MDTTLNLLNLAGAIALLLWGVHMVQSGVQRAFGSDLRRFLAMRSATGSKPPPRASASPPSYRAALRRA